MPELSPPNNTLTNDSAAYKEKLQAQQNRAKAEEQLFTLELFLFLEKKRDLLLNQQSDQLKPSLEQIAKDCGYSDLTTALNHAKNARGQSALTQALQDQEFHYANALLQFGAQFDAQSREEYDIAIDSERGQDARDKNLISPPPLYVASDPEKLHPVKEFGLVLGLQVTSKDGVSSQRAHIGPAYKLMTHAVSDYARTCNKEPAQSDFKEVADAFKVANSVSNFKSSNPKGSPPAGEQLAQRIQKGEVTTVPVSCKGHAMGLSFAPVKGDPNKTYLIFTNRGEGAGKTGKFGTQIFEVDKRDITPEFLDDMMRGHHGGKSHDAVMGRIQEVTKGKDPVHFVPQEPQKYDNCTIVNCRSNIEGILLCQEANRKGGFSQVNKEEVRQRYTDFEQDMERKSAQKLVDAFRNDPGNTDLQQLVQAYRNKEPNHTQSVDPVQPQASEPMRSPK